MNYKETLDYLYQSLPMFQRQGASAFKKDLTNIKALCEKMGNPQKNLTCIHIAGTNGKGSVSHLLAAILSARSYKTGLYISPHYKDFRERIKIDGKYIDRQQVVAFVDQYKQVFEEIHPSFFEMTVAMAFWYFNKQKVDYAIIETGLGGRLDSTNIIRGVLSIITNISFDHMDMLGDTLEKIAFEKAGIIKANCPVLIGRRQKETEKVFVDKANECHAEIYFADQFEALRFKENELGISKIEGNFNGSLFECVPDLKALYQKENLNTVWAAIQIGISKNIFSCSKESIIRGISDTSAIAGIMGRWQILQLHPLIIAESAHNEDGIRYLLQGISKINYEKLHLVCGFVKDKPLDKVFSMLPKNASYYFCKANIPRGKSATDLQLEAKQFDLKGKAYVSVSGAFKAAKRAANKKDLIIISGSIFVVAEIL